MESDAPEAPPSCPPSGEGFHPTAPHLPPTHGQGRSQLLATFAKPPDGGTRHSLKHQATSWPHHLGDANPAATPEADRADSGKGTTAVRRRPSQPPPTPLPTPCGARTPATGCRPAAGCQRAHQVEPPPNGAAPATPSSKRSADHLCCCQPAPSRRRLPPEPSSLPPDARLLPVTRQGASLWRRQIQPRRCRIWAYTTRRRRERPEPTSLADGAARPRPSQPAREERNRSTPPPSSRPRGVPAARSGGGAAEISGQGAAAARVWLGRPSPARGDERTLLAVPLLGGLRFGEGSWEGREEQENGDGSRSGVEEKRVNE
jgi:hypothetical protein